MADLNNLTTLAKRLRPLLGTYIQNLGGQLIGEGPGIDIVKIGDVNIVGLGGDTFLLYDSSGNPVDEYATLTLALAAATPGDVVLCPEGTFTEDVTVPAGVGVTGIGNKTLLIGTITLGGPGSVLKSILIEPTVNSGDTIIGVIGPSSGVGYINDCSIRVKNNGNGDAYGIQGGDGELWIWSCYTEGISEGGYGYAVVSSMGDIYIYSGALIGSTEPLGGM